MPALDGSLRFVETAPSLMGHPGPVIAAAAVAGAVGVRGLIDGVAGGSAAEVLAALRRDVELMGAGGVRRVHLLVPTGSAFGEVAAQLGFRACPGENLYVRSLESPHRGADSALSGSVCIRNGTGEDLARVGLQLADVAELAFEPWEMPLIARSIGAKRRMFQVVVADNSIVGVAIGGSIADVGTISHLWIHREYRHLHLGSALCSSALQALQRDGARSVYLMTTAGNAGADRFWERQGFHHQKHVSFMEIDL